MTTQEAIDQIDREFGIFSQAVVVDADAEGNVTLAPNSPDSLYDNSDFEFLQAKIKELVTVSKLNAGQPVKATDLMASMGIHVVHL